VILEVGLGGRLDAVNAIDSDCAIITSVDVDHVEYLGPDRESIGREKAGIMRNRQAGDRERPGAAAKRRGPRARDRRRPVAVRAATFNYSGDKQQWSWAGRDKRFNGLAYPALRGANQLLNASGVLAAFEALRVRLPITAQSVRNGFALVELPGRFQIVPGQPTLVLDVAHNPHAVATLAQNLDQMGLLSAHPRGVRRNAGQGPRRDHEAHGAPGGPLAFLRPAAAARREGVRPSCPARATRLAGPGPVGVHCHADPLSALRGALGGADPADRIVVFGSFYTVGGVLKEGLPD
jgi:dihydrofolate synthase/folylpolyglutamate synthase